MFCTITGLFGGAFINKPERLLEGEFTRSGPIEHHFVALGAISIFFIKVERIHSVEQQQLETKGQVLAECADMPNTLPPFGLLVPVSALRY